MPRVLQASVYVEQPGGLGATVIEGGTSEATIREEKPYALGQLGDHVWVDAPDKPAEDNPAVGEVTQVQLAEAIQRADALEAEKAQLQAEVDRLRAEVQELLQQIGEDDPGSVDEVQREGGPTQPKPLPDNVDKLKKDELKALAAERGVEVDDDDTNAQIVEKLQASVK